MKRLTEKRDGKNVIPLRNAITGIDIPYWKISRANDLEMFLYGNAADRLAAYEDAEEQELLIRLPFKVGDCVYYLNPFDEIEKGKITMIQQKADGTWKFRVTTSFSHDVTLDALGKTVFLSKEEAEKALEGMR